MNRTILELSMKVKKLCDTIGRSNGHACPPSQDPIDAHLHELYIARLAKKVFEGREEAALKNLDKELSEPQRARITSVIDAATKIGTKHETTVLSGQHYTYNFAANKPAQRFSVDKLKLYLRKKGWTQEMIDAALADCYDTNAPAKSHTVVPTGQDDE